jgi:hypothetical protein
MTKQITGHGSFHCFSPAVVRTPDPVVNSHLLCQLSYRGIKTKYQITRIKIAKDEVFVNIYCKVLSRQD